MNQESAVLVKFYFTIVCKLLIFLLQNSGVAKYWVGQFWGGNCHPLPPRNYASDETYIKTIANEKSFNENLI